jgi:hypothetical protein
MDKDQNYFEPVNKEGRTNDNDGPVTNFNIILEPVDETEPICRLTVTDSTKCSEFFQHIHKFYKNKDNFTCNIICLDKSIKEEFTLCKVPLNKISGMLLNNDPQFKPGNSLQYLSYKIEFIRMKTFKVYDMIGKLDFKKCADKLYSSYRNRLPIVQPYFEKVTDMNKVFNDNEKEDIVIIVTKGDESFKTIYANNKDYCTLFICSNKSVDKKLSELKNVKTTTLGDENMFTFSELSKFIKI